MKTKSVHDLLTLKMPAVCESCGERFGCGANSDYCWCAKTKLSEAARQELNLKFRDCLCPNCLEKYALSEAEK